ncbi:methylated-DNA--[protein]-cysteine S-methyltransferase [Cardinium endosymbiont of Sogatella furcifera]|uniref:methylated-DNA--[protein]-cysteine S-methyltransferase n=1 Tax=Cardinium endosymbiont of Sogatella furcifera TaxID=650378 RepID=UPI000E0D8E9A|nr:methylated-DNA--[protein]-cysteine S-methyltransferase [Cardinium endosymbiont of Sogatella furcifera]AXI24310.1 methylated-DNA--[protein]-cysteine S-methyltransferase [Cardinium endosymbiont of Sogatella furcifera]
MKTISLKWVQTSSNAIDSLMIYYTYINTRMGRILLTASNDKLIGLHIEGQKHFPIIKDYWQHNPHIAVFTNTKIQLNDYFRLKSSYFNIDYRLNGTSFQKNIWQSLTRIPYGVVCTYKTFASLTAYPHAIRAVASAIGKNPLSILLPCHRVIRSDGSLGGYAAGTAVKKQLLTLEAQAIS